MKRAAIYGSLAALLCACGGYSDDAAQPGELARPPATPPPDAEARRQADTEAARSFATDDPRVAKGIAENKEAFDGDSEPGVDQPQ